MLLFEQYLKDGGYDLVLEGLFTWDNANSNQGDAKHLIDMAQNYGFKATSIVLRAEKEELLRRNSERQYSVPNDGFEELYNNIYQTVDPSEAIVGSTKKSARC